MTMGNTGGPTEPIGPGPARNENAGCVWWWWILAIIVILLLLWWIVSRNNTTHRGPPTVPPPTVPSDGTRSPTSLLVRAGMGRQL